MRGVRHHPRARVHHPDGGGLGACQGEEVRGGPAVGWVHQGGKTAMSHALSHIVWHEDGVPRHGGGLSQVQEGESEHLYKGGAGEGGGEGWQEVPGG